jgi:hypothetical protein
VKKRKRRKIVAIVGGISTVVIATFAIVAFLGRFVGTFTVSLESRNVELTLLEKKESDTQSSFLRVDTLAPFQEFTYGYFDNYGGDEVIDNEETTIRIGANINSRTGEIKSLNFFKYTYYVKNIGKKPAMYDWSVNVLDDVKAHDGRTLLDTLRVMMYVDGEKTIYGKGLSQPHYDEHGNPDYRAPISVDEDEATPEFPFQGYAERFNSSKVITTFHGQELDVGEMKRYTIVTWLEGFRSSNDSFAPRGATVKLGVEINAYENE